MIAGEVRCVFVIQQMLRGVRWERLPDSVSQEMSADLERKEVKTMSNRCVRAIHLVRLFAVSVQGEPRRYSGSRRRSATREAMKVKLHFSGEDCSSFTPCKSIHISMEAPYSSETCQALEYDAFAPVC